MNGFFALLGRTLRGFRLVEFAAHLVLLAMVLGVYLAKASAGRERGDIASVQSKIEDEQRQVRMLQAEVAHLEEPRNIERLAAMAGLGPTNPQHEASPDSLAQIARAGSTAAKGPTAQAGGAGALTVAAAGGGARQ